MFFVCLKKHYTWKSAVEKEGIYACDLDCDRLFQYNVECMEHFCGKTITESLLNER